MGVVGSVPLHLHYKEEELSESSRQSSCASTSTTALSAHRSETSSTKQDLDQPKKSVGQKVDHAILNLAPAFFSLDMVCLLACTMIDANSAGYRNHIDTTIQSTLQRRLAPETRYHHLRPQHHHLCPALDRPCCPVHSLQRLVHSFDPSPTKWHVLGHITDGSRHYCRKSLIHVENVADYQNMLAFVCAPWSYRWAQFTLGLWWIDILMSILVNFGMVFVM